MKLYVRDLTPQEGTKIREIIRKNKNAFAVRRAQVILASAQGMDVAEIAELYYYSTKQVKRIIKGFNTDGFKIFNSNYTNGGRPPIITEDIEAEIVETAQFKPKNLGLPFTQWSLTKLKDYLISNGIVKEISIEEIRQILKKNKISYQRTKTWKESNDPEFDVKKNE